MPPEPSTPRMEYPGMSGKAPSCSLIGSNATALCHLSWGVYGFSQRVSHTPPTPFFLPHLRSSHRSQPCRTRGATMVEIMKQQEFVVVANRLPVNAHKDEEGSTTFERAPGGLVSALAPMMTTEGGAWVGWAGAPDEDFAPFSDEGINMVPVPLSQPEVETYYEGFSNTTLWPLYHDVIVDPEYHREWWTTYREVNQRFADAAAQVAAHGATVWVHDYQLQLVPNMLRVARPDLKIGFFLHIPFPPKELFGQLSWREDILHGLLGSDLVGFQRSGDADNFLRSVRQYTELGTRGMVVNLPEENRSLRAGAFPIPLDSKEFNALARSRPILQRAKQIRADLGNPEKGLLGVVRCDYTKANRHRLKDDGERFEEGHLKAGEVAMVQVVSSSREKVEEYIHLRSEVEETVGRINGDYGNLGQPVIHYLHQSYPWEEMAAMYRAADVMLVTSLRDGMNLVAKEYVAARGDLDGALILSEFTGAADELRQALQVNPHDIEKMKSTILYALTMDREERRTRMRAMRRRVLTNDVQHWANTFLRTLTRQAGEQ